MTNRPHSFDRFPPELLLRVEECCARFETDWKAGGRPRLDDYLVPSDAPEYTVLLQELILLDAEYRRQAGETPRATDYSGRFPAVEATWLDDNLAETCNSAPTGPNEPLAATVGFVAPAESAGTMVAGRFKLLQQIGEGGMGTVWVAEQIQPVRRKVALKLIKAGMDSKTVLARFEAERQALALMDHPSIARVLDGGTTESGRPFFVMEYVNGVPLTKYCDDACLSVQARLALFVPVCQAVQHAHQKGIIHRDLKPSNILVSLHDGQPVPKVIDFGLAKAMHQPLTEHTLHTAHGTMMGTPLYMSPEQADVNNLDVDTRTDIYALGVILYELLTGTTPLEKNRVKNAAWPEMLRLIKEEEPPRPSTRLSGSGALPGVAAQRQLEPGKLTRLVRGELDWIVMKALEKERSRRYETANGLARDIQRFLADEAVEACPPSASYRLRKFARKYRAALLTAATILLLLLAGVGVSAWQAIRATEAETLAKKSERMAIEQEQEAKKHATSAKENENKANKAVGEIDEARRKAEEQQRRFQRLSATLLLEKGQNLCDQEDLGRGLLWLARSLQFAPTDDADLQRVIRVNLADWQRPFFPLRAVFSHGKGRIDAIAISPNGKSVLTGGNDWTARLWDAATGQSLAKPLAHKGSVVAVAFSPDGKTVVTGSTDGTAQLWDANTGMRQGKALQHKGTVRVVAFSPDSKTILTGSSDYTARLWDAGTGASRGEPLRHENEVRAAGFSPNGKTVLTGSMDKTARLWEAATGKPIGAPLQHNKAVVAVAFSLVGKRLAATASEDMTVRLWDAASGLPHGEPLNHGGTVKALAFSPISGMLLTGSADQNAHLWNASTGIRLQQWKHDASVSAVAFSSDGNTLLTGSLDQTVRLWNRSPRQLLGAPLPHQSEVVTALFGPSGKTVLTATRERTARLWEVASRPLASLALVGHEEECQAAAFSPNGKLVLTGSVDGTARLWNAGTGKPVGSPLPHENWVVAVAFSPDSTRALTGSRDNTARLWDIATGQLIGQPLGHDGPVMAVAFSPDGRTAVTTSADATARLWETATGNAIGRPLAHRGSVMTAIFSPDGKTVVTASADKTAAMWDAATGKPLNVILKHQGNVFAAAFSPDGTMLATGSGDETAQLWEAATGKSLGECKHQGAVRTVSFSPNGKFLATGSEDRTARIWDVTTQKPVCQPLTHQRGVLTLAFSPDGTMIATGSKDGTARFWDIATGTSLGTPMKHPFREVLSVAFSPNGKRIVTSGEQRVTRLWPVPVPVSGEVERIVLWTQVLTGMELDADGAVGTLDAARWYERRRRLEELGGPPAVISSSPGR